MSDAVVFRLILFSVAVGRISSESTPKGFGVLIGRALEPIWRGATGLKTFSNNLDVGLPVLRSFRGLKSQKLPYFRKDGDPFSPTRSEVFSPNFYKRMIGIQMVICFRIVTVWFVWVGFCARSAWISCRSFLICSRGILWALSGRGLWVWWQPAAQGAICLSFARTARSPVECCCASGLR